jgi:two-component system, NarL family, response regulator NreC
MSRPNVIPGAICYLGGTMPLAQRVRLVLADDHTILRDGLRVVLKQEGFEVLGEASNGHEAIQLCAKLNPDVAVLDIGMPLLNGIDAAHQLAKLCPETKVVLLTQHTEESYIVASLRAGIRGYVLKSKAFSELVNAIRAVCKGEVYLSRGVCQPIIERFLAGTEDSADPLSAREREVLQLIAEGKRAKDIGIVLGISTRTAESHRCNIMEKLGIHDIPGLVRYAIRQGMVTA